MVTVHRLEHDRIADASGGRDRVIDVAHGRASWNRDANTLQQLVRELLVAGDINGNVARFRCHRRPDPLLVAAIPHLNQRPARIKPDDRDLAALGLVDQCLGARTIGEALGEQNDALELILKGVIGIVLVNEVVQQVAGGFAGRQAKVWLHILIDDGVNAALVRGAGKSPGNLRTGQRLELKRDMLQHMAHPRAIVQTLDEAARFAERAVMLVERRYQTNELVVETFDLVAGAVFQLADVHLQQNHRHPCPDIRSAVDLGFQNLNRHLHPLAH